MHRGYTRSWRKKYDSRSASRGLLYLGAMDWLVGNANWKDGWVNGEPVRRGQIFVGRRQLSQVWHVSEQNVRTILHNLAADGFLTIDSTNKGTVVTISNYDIYQPEPTNDQPTDQPTTNQRPTTSKELKELKEEGKGIVAPAPMPEYPSTVESVLEIAERPEVAVAMSREEADRYLTIRAASDWIDAAGRKIQPHRVGYDIKKWALNRSGAQAQDDKNRATEPGRENEGKDKIGF